MLYREDYLKELKVPTLTIGKGGDSSYSKKIQEWINLHKYHTQGFSLSIGIDGDYGRITESAVEDFQELVGLEVTGKVDALTWMQLVAPMQKAFSKITCSHEYPLREVALSYAQQFADQHPTEIGNNTGPWVRAFMKGKEGDWAAWCCGSICTAIDHGANSLETTMDNW
jgi:peptidoglycan hydrolase-like protein with peptidoglycan-binding domain